MVDDYFKKIDPHSALSETDARSGHLLPLPSSGGGASTAALKAAAAAAVVKARAAGTPMNMILDYPHMFPFSWKRSELYSTGTSLFQGSGFFPSKPPAGGSSPGTKAGDIPAYSIHLFHSQSEGASRYFNCERDSASPGGKRMPSNNIGEAIRRAVGDAMVPELCRLLDQLPYYSANIQTELDANKKRFGLT
jgi:hypothetical protein